MRGSDLFLRSKRRHRRGLTSPGPTLIALGSLLLLSRCAQEGTGSQSDATSPIVGALTRVQMVDARVGCAVSSLYTHTLQVWLQDRLMEEAAC
jgi:hypothetical protein